MKRNPICSLYKHQRKPESDLVSTLFHHLPLLGIWDQPNVICQTMLLCQLPGPGIQAKLLCIGGNGELILRRNELFWGQTSTQIKLTISLETGPHNPQLKCSTGAIHSPQISPQCCRAFSWDEPGSPVAQQKKWEEKLWGGNLKSWRSWETQEDAVVKGWGTRMKSEFEVHPLWGLSVSHARAALFF